METTTLKKMARRLRGERGQSFVGYAVIITAFMLLTIAVTKYFVSVTKEDQVTRQWGEQALQTAHAGFIDAFAWFRRNRNTTKVDGLNFTTSIPGTFPDMAFDPGPDDTDFFSLPPLDPTGNSAIVRTLHAEHILHDAIMNTSYTKNSVWMRYVVKRQFLQNFPMSLTWTATNHDPQAVHDISHQVDGVSPGEGSRWAITSRGYVFRYPVNITETAAHEGGKLYNRPLLFYKGHRLRLGAAEVTGTIRRLDYHGPEAAVWVRRGNDVDYGSGCTIDQGDGQGHIARNDTSSAVDNGGDLVGSYFPGNQPIPSYDNAFGVTFEELLEISDVNGNTHTCFPTSYVTDIEAYKEEISTQKFMILTTGSSSVTFTFNTPPAAPDPNHRILNGNGLLIVNGNLLVEEKTGGAWNGVVFVDGDVTLNKPFEIRGTLIATGDVELNGDPDVVELTYSTETIAQVERFMFNYRIMRNSIQSRFLY